MMMRVPLRVLFTVHAPICPLLLRLGLFLRLDLRVNGGSFSPTCARAFSPVGVFLSDSGNERLNFVSLKVWAARGGV